MALMCSTSCSDWLDLKPESEIILDEYWKTEQDVEAVLASCYKSLTEDDVMARMIVWGELRSDNLVVGLAGIDMVKRYDMYRILQGNITSTNAYASWSAFYRTINYCNTLLHYAPYVLERDENFTQADLNRVKAEALTIRALSYFYLVRSFKDVPWMSEASITDNQNYNRKQSPDSVVLKNIITDLKVSKQYLPTDYGRDDYNHGRFTQYGASALLADIYLWQNDYKNCINECDYILANPKFKLESPLNSYTQIFYFGNSTESIFELQFNDDVQKNNMVNELYGSASAFPGELSFPTTLAYNPYSGKAGAYSPFYYKVASNVYESEKDIRAKDSYNVYTNNIFKYVGLMRIDNTAGTDGSYAYRTRSSNWIIYRLPDIMLMKAEALVEQDQPSTLKKALELVNTTYARSNSGQDSLVASNYPTRSEMQSLVLRERQRELLFEGKRWYDLVRMAKREGNTNMLNDYVNHKSSGNAVTLGAPVLNAMYMPISLSELEANTLLDQNSYYSTKGTR